MKLLLCFFSATGGFHKVCEVDDLGYALLKEINSISIKYFLLV